MFIRKCCILLIAGVLVGWAALPSDAQVATKTDQDPSTRAKSFYDHEVKTIDERMVSLSAYKGKVCLVVNTASQ